MMTPSEKNQAKNEYSKNSPVDKTELSYPTTSAILDGVDETDGAAVDFALGAYKERRIEEIRNTPTTVTADEGATAYYVSAQGNDENDGKAPERAWKSLEKVSSMVDSFGKGDVIYFRRGDTFRGKLSTADYVTYSAYGSGAKPIINGSLRNYAGSDFWKSTDTENIYEASDTFADDVGNIVFDESFAGFKKAKGINGTELLCDLEFYHEPESGRLTLYSTSNPNTRFKSIEICTQGPVIGAPKVPSVSHCLTIDNLCVKYGGGYAIRYSHGTTDFKTTNCEIGWCGGALQDNTVPNPVRLGNAVEVFSTVTGFIVDNCYIYEMYDAGVSHQFFGSSKTVVRNMRNIKYTNNVITRCSYALEYVNSHEMGIMENVEVSGNLFLEAGMGFGKQRPDRHGSTTACIKAWGGANNSKNFLIYDNVIETKDSYAILIHMTVNDAVNMPHLSGNIFANIRGQRFGLYGTGRHSRDKDMITYNENIPNITTGLEDNTFVFFEK